MLSTNIKMNKNEKSKTLYMTEKYRVHIKRTRELTLKYFLLLNVFAYIFFLNDWTNNVELSQSLSTSLILSLGF